MSDMMTGELAEPVQKRSVLRQLHMKISGEGGHYGADISQSDGMAFASCGPLPGYAREPGRQVTAAVNSLAAGEALPHTLLLQGVLPEGYEEALLQADMKQIAAEADAHGLKLCDAGIQVSRQVQRPQYFVTAVGTVCRDGGQPLLRPGDALVVTGWIALAGTAALATQYEEELLKKFSFQLIDRAKEFGRWMSVTEAARAVSHFGLCSMHCLAQGGIFHALWEMAERAGVGLEVDLRKIPVKQETVEICEYFDINPYYLYSAGSLLIGTGQAETLTALLAGSHVAATVIGYATDGNDRVIRNGEERRFLDRPRQDEWWRRIDNERADFNFS